MYPTLSNYLSLLGTCAEQETCCWYIYIHIDIQTYRHTDIQKDRQTDIQTYIHTYNYIHTYSLLFPKLLCHFGYFWLKCDSNCHHSFWQAATQVRQPHQALAKDKGLKAVFNREPYVFFQESQFFPQGVVNVSSTEGLSSSERPGIATQSRFPDVNIPINQPRYLLESPDSLFESGSSGSTS